MYFLPCEDMRVVEFLLTFTQIHVKIIFSEPTLTNFHYSKKGNYSQKFFYHGHAHSGIL